MIDFCSMAMRIWWVLFLAVGGGGGLAGCDVFDPSLYMRAGDGGGDAASDGGAEGGAADCGPRRFPKERPMADDGSDVGEVAVVLKDIVFNQLAGRWRGIGFDLDGICTTTESPRSECRSVEPIVDGEGGIDNAFGGRLFVTINAFFQSRLEQTAQTFQALGVGSLAVIVRGWNGTPNDPSVDVIVAQTVFGTTAAMAAMPDFDPARVQILPETDDEPARLVLDDGSGGTMPLPPPTWDGNDVFFVRSDAFVDGDIGQPIVRDERAYVVDGQLVVQIPDRITLAFSGGSQGVLIRVQRTVSRIQMPSSPTELDASLDATIAGRWAVSDIVQSATALGICAGTSNYDTALNVIQGAADLLSRPDGDPSQECDAVSFGFRMTGRRGVVGGTVDPPPLPNPCLDADAGAGG